MDEVPSTQWNVPYFDPRIWTDRWAPYITSCIDIGWSGVNIMKMGEISPTSDTSSRDLTWTMILLPNEMMHAYVIGRGAITRPYYIEWTIVVARNLDGEIFRTHPPLSFQNAFSEIVSFTTRFLFYSSEYLYKSLIYFARWCANFLTVSGTRAGKLS